VRRWLCSGFLLLCLLWFRSAGLCDAFDEVSRYCENRNRVLPEREDYEGTLDGVRIGDDFLVPAVSVRDSVVSCHACIPFGGLPGFLVVGLSGGAAADQPDGGGGEQDRQQEQPYHQASTAAAPGGPAGPRCRGRDLTFYRPIRTGAGTTSTT
jgi:hypothetical protein